MKKLIFILFIVINSSVFAQQSSLSIFSEDGKSFYLILNGIRQNHEAETNVRVDQLEHNYYSTKIVFADQMTPTLEKKVLSVVDADGKKGAVTYKLKHTKKGKLVLRFYSFTPAAEAPPAPPAPQNVRIVRYNTEPMPAINFTTTTHSTTTTTTTDGDNGEDGDNVNIGVNIGGVNIGMNVNIDGENSSGSTSTTTTTTTTTSSSDMDDRVVVGNDEVIIEEAGCYTISSSDFDQALASIKSKSFSDSKLTLAKQVAKSNCLTAAQIKEIITAFDHESVRLEFAQYAYPLCYNPENYWKINDAFQFESTIDELNEFIETQR